MIHLKLKILKGSTELDVLSFGYARSNHLQTGFAASVVVQMNSSLLSVLSSRANKLSLDDGTDRLSRNVDNYP